jgi:phage host-nuclease inhibitor protein Gam
MDKVNKRVRPNEPVEPDASFVLETEYDLAKLLDWYRENCEVKNSRKWIYDYMKLNSYTKDMIDSVRQVKDSKISMTSCAIARMFNNGVPLFEKNKTFITNKIQQYINDTDKEQIEETPRPSVQTYIKKQSSNIIFILEAKIDEFINNGYTGTFKFYDFYVKQEIKGPQAKVIVDYYKPLFDELTIAVNSKDKTDEAMQIKEAYASIGKVKLKTYFDFISSIYNDANRIYDNNKVIRKRRKTKTKTVSQITGKVKYQNEDVELKIISVSPAEVLGSKCLWVYNTKYKQLGVYYASNEKGLSFKGTTLQNFEEATSMRKSIRKPNEILQKVLSGGKVVLKHLMDEIKAKPSVLTGRINEDTILLKVQK